MRTVSRVILSAVLLVLTAVLAAIAIWAPDAFFSFYPDFSRKAMSILSTVTSPLPFALWEILVLLLVLWFFYTLIRCIIRKKGFVRWLAGILAGVSIGVFLFTSLWGLGHFGPTVGERLGLSVRPYSKEELYAAAVHYRDEANEYAGKVDRDETGVVRFRDFSELAKAAPAAYEALAEEYDFFEISGARVKRLTAAPIYSYMGVTGVFMPITGESSVNPNTFVASLPFTMCHELGHRAGFPAEDDANFCGVLGCMATDDPEFRYSGAYSAFVYCYNSLCDMDRELSDKLWEGVSEEVRTDCRAAREHYKPYEGKVQEAAQAVNDVYLKAFREEDGVRSYGAVTDYLIAWYLRGEGKA